MLCIAGLVQAQTVSATLPQIWFGDVEWADINGDSLPDLFLTGTDSLGDAHSSCWENTGSGFLQVPSLLPSSNFQPLRQSAAEWGDIDLDGDLDLVICGLKGDHLPWTGIYLNSGGNQFSLITSQLPGCKGAGMALGDVDADGDLDLIMSGFTVNGDTTLLFLNDTSQALFTAGIIGIDGVSGRSLDLKDFEGDGDLDLVINGLSPDVQQVCQALAWNGNGFTSIPGLPRSSSGSVSWGDADGIGNLDVLVLGARDGHYQGTAWYYTSGQLKPSPWAVNGLCNSGSAWADYDGDGLPDVAVAGEEGPNLVCRIYQNTTSGFVNINAPNLVGLSYPVLKWTDVNNDGDPDLSVSGLDASGTPRFLIYLNSNGSFSIY